MRIESRVITIEDNPRSVKAAQRCIDSMPEYNVQMHAGFTPEDDVYKLFENENLRTTAGFDPKNGKEYSYKESAMAAFLSHRSIWLECYATGKEYQIFEHDAVAINPIPEFLSYTHCVSLGQPSYGNYRTPTTLGVGPLVSKPYFPGAHAYRLKPKGAEELIKMSEIAPEPTDIFLRIETFPWLQELYPWPVVADDSFTTIQRPLGCQAKHNWDGGETYKIIR